MVDFVFLKLVEVEVGVVVVDSGFGVVVGVVCYEIVGVKDLLIDGCM